MEDRRGLGGGSSGHCVRYGRVARSPCCRGNDGGSCLGRGLGRPFSAQRRSNNFPGSIRGTSQSLLARSCVVHYRPDGYQFGLHLLISERAKAYLGVYFTNDRALVWLLASVTVMVCPAFVAPSLSTCPEGQRISMESALVCWSRPNVRTSSLAER